MANLEQRDIDFLDKLTEKGVSRDRQYDLLNKARAAKGLEPVQEASGLSNFVTGFGKGSTTVARQLSRLQPGDQKADPTSFFNMTSPEWMQKADLERRKVGQNTEGFSSKAGEFVGEVLPTVPASMGTSALLNLGLRGAGSFAPAIASKVAPFVKLGGNPTLGNVAKFGAFEGAKDQILYDTMTTGKPNLLNTAIATAGGSLLGAGARAIGKMGTVGKEGINKSKLGAYTESAFGGLTDLETRLNKTYRVDPTKYIEFQKMTGGKTIGKFAAERGIVDTPEEAVVQFTQRGRKSMEEADKGLDAITGNFKNDKLQKALIDLRDEAIAAEDDTLGEIASNLVKKHDSTGLTMKEINEAKRLYEKNNKFNYLRANDAKAYRRATNLDDAIREFQFKQADLNGFPELRAINKETQANFAAANAIDNKLSKQLGNNEFGLTDWIVASGAMHNPQALGALLGKKFLSSAEGQKLYNKLLQKFDKTPQVTPPIANTENIGIMQTFKQSLHDSIPRLRPPLSNSQSGNRLIPDEITLPTGETGVPTSKGPYPSADPTITSRSKIVKPGTYTETPIKKEVQATVIPKTEVKAETKLPKTPQEGKTAIDEAKKYNSSEKFVIKNRQSDFDNSTFLEPYIGKEIKFTIGNGQRVNGVIYRNADGDIVGIPNEKFTLRHNGKTIEGNFEDFEIPLNSNFKLNGHSVNLKDGGSLGDEISKDIYKQSKPKPSLPPPQEGKTKLPLGERIMKEGEQKPTIKLKRDVQVTTIDGEKVTIDEGEVLKAWEAGGKARLKDGREYIVSKSQYENIKNNSKTNEVKEFAPELKGTEESILGDNVKGAASKSETYKALAKDAEARGDTEQAKKMWEKYDEQKKQAPYEKDSKYSNYQLPGGENYKEVLIKAPVETSQITKLETRLKEIEKLGKDATHSQKQEWADIMNKLKPETRDIEGVDIYKGFPTFRSSHWDEPNVLAHLRLNERTYNGKKVTFMEELQSDWAREGRSKGFIGENKTNPRVEAKALLDSKGITFEQDMSGEANLMKNGDAVEYDTLDTQTQKAVDTYLGSAEQFDQIATTGVPNNPLLKNWQELSIKRALKEAVDNKSDYFAWINGEQTSARYNLATHLDKAEWGGSNLSDRKIIDLQPKGDKNPIRMEVTPEGKIYKAEGNGIREWGGKQLDEVLGKGLADKIMEKEKGTLSGEGLKFGGEWASNLYDKQVGNIVKDLTGAKVEMLDMGLPLKDMKEVNVFKIVKNDKGSRGDVLTSDNIKVGDTVAKNFGEWYIITDITGDGKFKAVPQIIESQRLGKIEVGKDIKLTDPTLEREKKIFDISTKKSPGQQGIKITPELRAMIKGKQNSTL